MIEVDGSQGEGGGQIVRSSLGLALLTGKATRIFNIRAGRSKPGLGRQHLTAVRAAAEVGDAEFEGAEMGSGEVFFRLGEVRPGSYNFDVGSAGSCTLVLQTVLPALLTADEPTRLRLQGGTHNPFAPPYEFLAETFLPLVQRMGPSIGCELIRHGFYPAGGGCIEVSIEPARSLAPLQLLERGELEQRQAVAIVANLPRHIGERELDEVQGVLGWPPEDLEVREASSDGPGNALVLRAGFEDHATVVTAFGKRGLPAEKVARLAISDMEAYLSSQAPVDSRLADQLLIPLAMAGGGRFRTLEPTSHTRTNIEVIRRFLDVEIEVRELASSLWEVSVSAT